jgi:hypothetical protein
MDVPTAVLKCASEPRIASAKSEDDRSTSATIDMLVAASRGMLDAVPTAVSTARIRAPNVVAISTGHAYGGRCPISDLSRAAKNSYTVFFQK